MKIRTAYIQSGRDKGVLALMYITQKNFSRYWAFPLKEKREKNLLAANVKETYADLVRFSAVRTS